MHATVQPVSDSEAAKSSRFTLLSDLLKFRLNGLVMVTAMVGFYLGWRGEMNYGLLLRTMAGIGFLASGAAALNQLLEREFDGRMRRTASRPLPSGRMQPETVLILGCLLSALGLLTLALGVNLLTSFLGAVTLATYLFIYTPLKRRTPLNTLVGAVAGAFPPLMGWTAAQSEFSVTGWALFGILFYWQLPHFLAIAWMYRDDYSRAGFVMLPTVDPDGQRTGWQAVSHTLGLLVVSLCPFLFRAAGVIYLVGALILGVLFLAFAVRFARDLTLGRARRLFFCSIIYLPLLLGLLVIDKVRP